MMAKPVYQPVVRTEYVGACRYTGYIDRSIRFYLACGHEVTRKASQGTPTRIKCRDCGRAILAAQETIGAPS